MHVHEVDHELGQAPAAEEAAQPPGEDADADLQGAGLPLLHLRWKHSESPDCTSTSAISQIIAHTMVSVSCPQTQSLYLLKEGWFSLLGNIHVHG